MKVSELQKELDKILHLFGDVDVKFMATRDNEVAEDVADMFMATDLNVCFPVTKSQKEDILNAPGTRHV